MGISWSNISKDSFQVNYVRTFHVFGRQQVLAFIRHWIIIPPDMLRQMLMKHSSWWWQMDLWKYQAGRRHAWLENGWWYRYPDEVVLKLLLLKDGNHVLKTTRRWNVINYPSGQQLIEGYRTLLYLINIGRVSHSYGLSTDLERNVGIAKMASLHWGGQLENASHLWPEWWCWRYNSGLSSSRLTDSRGDCSGTAVLQYFTFDLDDTGTS